MINCVIAIFTEKIFLNVQYPAQKAQNLKLSTDIKRVYIYTFCIPNYLLQNFKSNYSGFTVSDWLRSSTI